MTRWIRLSNTTQACQLHLNSPSLSTSTTGTEELWIHTKQKQTLLSPLKKHGQPKPGNTWSLLLFWQCVKSTPFLVKTNKFGADVHQEYLQFRRQPAKALTEDKYNKGVQTNKRMRLLAVNDEPQLLKTRLDSCLVSGFFLRLKSTVNRSTMCPNANDASELTANMTHLSLCAKSNIDNINTILKANKTNHTDISTSKKMKISRQLTRSKLCISIRQSYFFKLPIYSLVCRDHNARRTKQNEYFLQKYRRNIDILNSVFGVLF